MGRLLKSKEEARAAVRDMVALLERQSRKKVQWFRSNNSLEFVNSTMDLFCCQNGILHETTNLYLPEQNGIAEQTIAIFFEIVWCMLYTAGVELHYWGEAFMYAIHIQRM